MATDSPNICPHLEPAEGGAPSTTSALAPPSEHPPHCRLCLCHTPPPRAPPRLSGDQRTRVSSSLGCGAPASTLLRVLGVQVPSSYLDIAGPVFQSPCKSQGSEVSAEKGIPGPLTSASHRRPPSSHPPPAGPRSLSPSCLSFPEPGNSGPPVSLLSDPGAQAPSPFLQTQKSRAPAPPLSDPGVQAQAPRPHLP